MNKIKIAIIITKLELGGAQKVVLSLCELLDVNKFEPILICGCGGILDSKVTDKYKTYFVKNLVRQINPIKDLKALFEIYNILKKENPNIVHTHSSKAGVIGRIAAKLANIKNILHTIHGFSFNDTQNLLTKNVYIILERLCSKFSKYLIPVSKENITKGLLNKIGTKGQYHYIRLGIDLDNFKNYNSNSTLRSELKIQTEYTLITTIGPFKPQKNLIDFVKVANESLKYNKFLKFVVVGDGVLRNKLENEIDKYKLNDNIFLLGWREDISNILHSSDIFVMTSLWEGLPISTIEAMSSGVVPVVNDVDGQREIIQDNINGFLIKPYDIQSMAKKILLLSNDKELRLKMSDNAKNTIDYSFSINTMIKKYEMLYTSCML